MMNPPPTGYVGGFCLEKKLKKEIYCPKCGRFLLKVQDRQTINSIKRCECGRYFECDPRKLTAKWVEKPQRTTSSGVMFN